MTTPTLSTCSCGEPMRPIYNGTVTGCPHCDQRVCRGGARLCPYCRRAGANVKQ